MIPLGVLASAYAAPASGGEITSSAYIGTATGTVASNVASVTVPIGAADADRDVIVVWRVGAVFNRTISSGTIGGVTVTSQQAIIGADNYGFSHARVPTGTSAAVSLTFSSGLLDVTAWSYRILSTYGITTGSVGSNVASPSATVTLDAVTGGIIIGHAKSVSANRTWTGAVEQYDSGEASGALGDATGGSLTASSGYTTTLAAGTYGPV